MTDKKIKAVLFDLGETLLNFGKVRIGPFFRQSCLLSYDYLRSCDQPLGSFRLYCWRNLLAIRWRYFLSAITGRDFDSLELLKKINEKKGIKLDRQQWQHLAWLWYEPLSKIAKIEPDLHQTLTRLKQMQLKLGILSNTFISASSLDKHLRQLGILEFFAIKLYSYEFDFRKPDQRIFEAAAHKIGYSPANIMFVGDRIDNDIAPALKLGMYVVMKAAFTNIGKQIPAGALKIDRLSELPAIIQKINLATAFTSA